MRFAIYAMVFLGAGLMVYNIYGFCRFAGRMRRQTAFSQHHGFLYLPVALLVMFLLGYLAVGLFGKPDLVVSGILFGGSIFVFIMYLELGGITRRLMDWEQMETRMLAAQEADRTKTAVLASVSHEMRTPLNVILGLNSMALRDGTLQPETRQQLEKVGQSARHLAGLIGNILDINRIADGTMAVKSLPFSLREDLEQVCAIAGTMCRDKGLAFEPSLPEGPDCRYIGDGLLLRQVLLALLDNAVKYTEAPGTVRLKGELLPDPGGDQTLRLTVSDTGVGMEPAFLPKLFQPFAREDDSSTDRFGGTGLGLTLTKKRVEMMGGTITAESKKNAGSAFTVTLPLQRCDSPEPVPAEQTAPAETEPVSLAGRRILVAEDVPENAEIVMDLLELEEMETEHAENGQIALNMVATSAPGYYDAVLMDLRMPVMDGLEATRRIRALDRPDAAGLPIIALTANAFDSDVEASLAAGMNAHLAKPTDAELLYETLRQCIGKRGGTA